MRRTTNLREKALELIEMEEDPKYQKKYAGVWKKRWLRRSGCGALSPRRPIDVPPPTIPIPCPIRIAALASLAGVAFSMRTIPGWLSLAFRVRKQLAWHLPR